MRVPDRESIFLGAVALVGALALSFVAVCSEPKPSSPPTPPESLYTPGVHP